MEEAKAFFNTDASNTARQAIGYKELKPYLDGEISLESAVEKLKMETRRYAKRQLTWFRNKDHVIRLYIDDEKSVFEECAQVISQYLGA